VSVYSVMPGLLALSLLACGRGPALSTRAEDEAERQRLEIEATLLEAEAQVRQAKAEALVLERILADPAPLCCRPRPARPQDKPVPALEDGRAQGLVPFEGDRGTPQERDGRLAQRQMESEIERQRLASEAHLREAAARVDQAEAATRQAAAEARRSEVEEATAALPPVPVVLVSPRHEFSDGYRRPHPEPRPRPTPPAPPPTPRVTPTPTPSAPPPITIGSTFRGVVRREH
jgi:hypothetical protein